jgi:hypothetical protein
LSYCFLNRIAKFSILAIPVSGILYASEWKARPMSFVLVEFKENNFGDLDRICKRENWKSLESDDKNYLMIILSFRNYCFTLLLLFGFGRIYPTSAASQQDGKLSLKTCSSCNCWVYWKGICHAICAGYCKGIYG